jgi:hypothetical protein
MKVFMNTVRLIGMAGPPPLAAGETWNACRLVGIEYIRTGEENSVAAIVAVRVAVVEDGAADRAAIGGHPETEPLAANPVRASRHARLTGVVDQY